MKNRTTLQLRRETLSDLKKFKKYRRETYEEILRRLMQSKKIGRKA